MKVKNTNPAHFAHGFTLIELMITAALAGILLSIAVPSFQKMIENNRASTQANNMLSSIARARTEAIKRGTPVSICTSTNMTSCSGSANWEDGWIVFSDLDSDTTIDDDGDATPCEVEANAVPEDCILTSVGNFEGNSQLRSIGFASNSSLNFNGQGFLNGTAGSFQLRTSGCIGVINRDIDIDKTGHTNVSKVNC